MCAGPLVFYQLQIKAVLKVPNRSSIFPDRFEIKLHALRLKARVCDGHFMTSGFTNEVHVRILRAT